jgi:hypothetical protein
VRRSPPMYRPIILAAVLMLAGCNRYGIGWDGIINTTQTARGSSEQLFYFGQLYVYLTNGLED